MARSKRKRSRILLAEDNEINQSLIAAILSKAGYPCDIVPDGRQVVERLLRKRYDLILMDCHMPEMDGFEATRLIRESEKAGMLLGKNPGPLPILALTANAMNGDRERCLDAGMTDYLSKPFNPERVIQMIDSYLASPRPRTPSASRPELAIEAKADPERQPPSEAAGAVPGLPLRGSIQAAVPVGYRASLAGPDQQGNPHPNNGRERMPATPPGPPSRFDFNLLLQRCMGDRELLDRIIARFRERSVIDLNQLECSIAAGDAAQVERLAHGFKGAAGNLSAGMLRELAAGMEAFGRAADLGGATALLAELRRELQRFFECVAAAEGNRPSRTEEQPAAQGSPEVCRF